MSIRIIFLDLDGTLLNSEKKITPSTWAALQRAANAGIEIVPCSGKRRAEIQDIIGEASFVHYVIASNGADIVDTKAGRFLHRFNFPAETARHVFALARTNGAWCGCVQDERLWLERGVLKMYPERASMLKKGLVEAADDLDAALAVTGFPVTKISLSRLHTPSQKPLLDIFTEAFPEFSVTSSVMHPGHQEEHVEIGSAAASKENGIRLLCAYLGIDLSESMALGDSLNDAGMLRVAGIGICMGNGTPEAKAAAAFLTDTNDRDGIAKALNHFLPFI